MTRSRRAELTDTYDGLTLSCEMAVMPQKAMEEERDEYSLEVEET